MIDHDFLLGDAQAHPAAFPFDPFPQLPHGAQKREGRVRGPRVQPVLHLPIGQLGAAAHEGPPRRRAAEGALLVQPQFPQHGGAHGVREQARGVLREFGRVQRRALVRGVEGLAAAVGLHVDRVARMHERGDVGDRVPHGETVIRGVDEHRLVQVPGALRIDRDELEVRAVQGR